MRIEIPAAAPLDTPFLCLPPPPGWGLLEGVVVAGGGGGGLGLNPTKNEDFTALRVSVKTKNSQQTSEPKISKESVTMKVLTT